MLFRIIGPIHCYLSRHFYSGESVFSDGELITLENCQPWYYSQAFEGSRLFSGEDHQSLSLRAELFCSGFGNSVELRSRDCSLLCPQ